MQVVSFDPRYLDGVLDVALADVSDSGLPEDATVAVARVRTDLTERNRRWRSAG
jgi:hypothetical protein